MSVRQWVEEAGFPSNLAQVPDFHCLIYGGCGKKPITAGIQGHVGYFLFVHSEIPKLQRKVSIRWRHRTKGGFRVGVGHIVPTSLPSVLSRITCPILSPVTTTRLLAETSRLQNQTLEGESALSQTEVQYLTGIQWIFVESMSNCLAIYFWWRTLSLVYYAEDGCECDRTQKCVQLLLGPESSASPWNSQT